MSESDYEPAPSFLLAPVAYGYLFQTEPYVVDKTFLPGVVRLSLDPLIIGQRISATDSALESIKDSSDIDPKNMHTIVFNGDEKIYIPSIDAHILSRFNPQAIQITDQKKLSELRSILVQSKDLKQNATFAGSLLLQSRLSWDVMSSGIKKSTLALGVIDIDTNKPLGIVFCSDQVLPFKIDDIEFNGYKKRLVIKQMSDKMVTVPVRF